MKTCSSLRLYNALQIYFLLHEKYAQLLFITVSSLSISTKYQKSHLFECWLNICFSIILIYSRYKCGTFCHIYSSSLHQLSFKLNSLLSFYDTYCNLKQTSFWSASSIHGKPMHLCFFLVPYVLFFLGFFLQCMFFLSVMPNKVLLKQEQRVVFMLYHISTHEHGAENNY